MNTRIRPFAALALLLLVNAFASSARGELTASASSEQVSYVRGRTNTLRFVVTLYSDTLEGGDSIAFAFPDRITISATRLIQGSSICSDQYLLALGMGSREGGWFTPTHPSGCGYFASSGEGVAHTIEVDAEIPADFVGDLPVAVTAKGDICCDGLVHETTAVLSFADQGSPAEWTFDSDAAGAGWSRAASEEAASWAIGPAGTHGGHFAGMRFLPRRAEALLTTPAMQVPAGGAEFRFRHTYSSEAGRDGGVLELAIDNGPFVDVEASGGHFIHGGYSQSLASDAGCMPDARNVLEGRRAWTGELMSFGAVSVAVPAAAAGRILHARWRGGTDCAGADAAGRWWIRDVELVPAAPVAIVQPAAVHMLLGYDQQRVQHLRIANPGGGRLAYSVFTAPADGTEGDRLFANGFEGLCAGPETVPWLHVTAEGTAVDGGEAADIDVDIDTSVLASGRHAALVCVDTSDDNAPRVAVRFDVEVRDPCSPNTELCENTLRVYTQRAAFMDKMAAGYNAQTFTGLRATEIFSPIAFGGENFGFGVFTGPDPITPRLHLFEGSGVLSTANPLDPLAFFFEGQAVTAFGGTFLGEIFESFSHQSRLLPAVIELTLGDGTIERIPASDRTGFRGITTSVPIQGFSVLGTGSTPEGDDVWGVASDFVVGAAR